MRHCATILLVAAVCALSASSADPACCYFSAIDKDVKQPGQRAFLTWDPAEKMESFTVQPMFEGNAEDFGMVVPTPTQPKLAEAPKDFFKALAIYTILKPLDSKKWNQRVFKSATGGGGSPESAARGADRGVKVLESGVVGSLDYKVIEATNPDGLYDWLKDNKYSFTGDKATLAFYIEKRWFFTVMKIDPKQMKKRADGTYAGDVTPTRFTFESDKLVYPLRITKISVKDKTDALFYIQAPEKMDLPGKLSYQSNFQTMWLTAFDSAVWEHFGQTEKDWYEYVKSKREELFREFKDELGKGRTPSTLEWARRLTDDDLKIASGEIKFDREAPAEEVKKLTVLNGILRKAHFVTKCRHVFYKDDMDEDLVFAEASFKGKKDAIEHVEIMPSSPP